MCIAVPSTSCYPATCESCLAYSSFLCPMPKRAECRYVVPAKGAYFFFSYPPSSSIVVHVATEPACPQKLTPPDWAALDLLGRKIYFSVALQFCIVNYQTLLAKYDFNNYAKLAEFLDDVLQDKRQHFRALIEEGSLVAKVGLEVAVDIVDMSSCSLAMGIVMQRDSWLQSFGFLWVIQTTL